MAFSWNVHRLIIDGPIGASKSTLLRRYVASFPAEEVSDGVANSKLIRTAGEPPILVLPEPDFRWARECHDFYAAATEEEASKAIELLQFRIVNVLLDRELFVLNFFRANPDAKVVQERGFSSMPIFMAANRELFDPDVYNMIVGLIQVFREAEKGVFRCLLTVSQDKEDNMVQRVANRGDRISEDYLKTIAKRYRDSASEYDAVWDPFCDDVLSNLTAVVERLQ